MRTKQIIKGLSNRTPVRVIMDGVGIYCKISDLPGKFLFTKHRIAVLSVLQIIAEQGLKGLSTSMATYDDNMTRSEVRVQVDINW